MKMILSRLFRLFLFAFPLHASIASAAGRPNIVFIISDDQGYGDLGHTGNPVVKTPHVDALAAESSSLTDFHVAPTCSPTRAALLTGHWSNRTGVWHTVNGRSMLRENEVTVAQMLADAGYATGHFGKWHLGDNFPYRPEDRGFTEVYRHGGGGVGQSPDLWDNAYFDGRYFRNGEIVKAEGFCTDVFFKEAQRFIREQARKKRPFFAYISTNAPHRPYHAPQKYLDIYEGQDPEIAAFYGMITNIDDNVGATRELLRELGIAENTLFIYTTDNGTSSGAKVFNAGMRGAKGSEYEGGHRVPFIAHWPAAGWKTKHVDDTLCHAIDIVPTLLEVTGADRPEPVKLDGVSIRTLLDPGAEESGVPEGRFIVTDSQRVRFPIKWKQTAVMSGKWRLVNGKELYDVASDPGQERNLYAKQPDRVVAMTAFYDAWWSELEPTFSQTTEIYLGHPDHPVVSVTGHDWIQEARPPWNQQHIREAAGYGPSRPGGGKGNQANAASAADETVLSRHVGHWAAKVVEAGRYRIAVRRWPFETDIPITAGLPAGMNVPGATVAFRARRGVAIPAVTATLRINGKEVAVKSVLQGDLEVVFEADLAATSLTLSPFFTDAKGNEVGAYFAVVSPVRDE